jgi:WD40 repeat protein
MSDGTFLTRDGRAVLSLENRPNAFLLRVRNPSDLKLRREIALETALMRARWSPDGKLFSVPEGQGLNLEVWDVATGKRLRSWKGHPGRTWGYEFTPDGKTLITCGEDKTIRFWEVATGKKVREVAYPDIVGLIVPSPDGSLLATVAMTEVSPGVGSWPRQDSIRLWDVKAGKEVRRLVPKGELAPKYRPGVFDVAFLPDGKAVAAITSNGVRLWDPTTGKELWTVPGGGRALTFSPKGETLAVANGPSVRLLEARSGKEVPLGGGYRWGVRFVAATGDGSVVATAAFGGPFRLWDAATGRERPRQLQAREEERAGALAALPDGRTLVTLGAGGLVRFWDLPSGRELRRVRTPLSPNGQIIVSPDGKVVLGPLEGEQGTGALVELATGKVLHKLRFEPRRFEPRPRPCTCSFTGDARTLVVCCEDRTAHVWDVGSGRRLRQFRLSGTAEPRRGGTFGWYATALSPQGGLLATGCPDHQYRDLALYDLGTGKAVRALEDLPDKISAIAFAPDGRMLAWGGSRSGRVHLVEVATGQERACFTGHKGEVHSLAFSADGRTLVSGSGDTTALVWDVAGRLTDHAGGKALPAELQACWADLAGENVARAYRALRQLASSAGAVELLRQRLRPVAIVEQKRLTRLIAELDSEEFAVREKASAELGRLDGAAAPACRKALEDRPSAEMRRRLERLLKVEDRERWSPSPDRLRQLRALEALELAGGAEAQRLLAELAKGMPGARLTEEAKAGLERLRRRDSVTTP